MEKIKINITINDIDNLSVELEVPTENEFDCDLRTYNRALILNSVSAFVDEYLEKKYKVKRKGHLSLVE